MYASPEDRPVPDLLGTWLTAQELMMVGVGNPDLVVQTALRKLPELILIDADGFGERAFDVGQMLKTNPHTSVVPVILFTSRHDTDEVCAWFEGGVDEVISPVFEPGEQTARLNALLGRTRRNVAVHPSTMLPGTPDIEREIWRRIRSGLDFAVCYTDLDYFKEYNDRYSYQNGDKVIYLVSSVLRDVVNGITPNDGFVGHIGGDDFIMILPLDQVSPVCSEVISIFDTLVPLQYSEQDRQAGHFLGKDRRGQLHRVPIMTLSIGVVTNEHRKFEHPARVSALATEMKSYAKSLPGSVFVLDRRRDLTLKEKEKAGVQTG